MRTPSFVHSTVLIIATHLNSSHKKAQKAHNEKTILMCFLCLFVATCAPVSRRALLILLLLTISFACNSGAKRVSLPARVTRVVSLAPNLTEIVFAVGGGDRLVGRTSYCDYPPEAKAVAEIGDTLHPSLERIIALKPQVVLISTSSQLEVFTQQLQNQNIAVFVTDPHDLEGVFRSIQQVGEMLGQKEQSDLLVQKLRERANAVEQAVKGKEPARVFYQVSGEPLYTAGHDAFVTDLMRRAGAI